MSAPDDDLAAFFAKRDELRRQAGLDDTPFPLERDPDPALETPTLTMDSAPVDNTPTRISYTDRDTELQSGHPGRRSSNSGVDHITAGHLGSLNESLGGKDGRSGMAADVRALLAEARAVRQILETAWWWLLAISGVLGLGGILAGGVAVVMGLARWVVG